MLTAVRKAFSGNSHEQCRRFEITFVPLLLFFFLLMYTLMNTFPLPYVPIVIRFVFMTSLFNIASRGLRVPTEVR